VNPKNFLILVILITFITISQLLILKPHLDYGFSDVDWGFLSIYKTQNPYNPLQFIHNLTNSGTQGGVYTHQIYYIGVQNEFFGLDFEKYQLTSHFFKILATIASFPIFLAISASMPVAFVATILFAFSYSAVGTMYTVVTSGDYLAIFSMGLFFVVYCYVLKKNSINWAFLLLAFILLVLTLFLSTERMYPLPLFIAFTELFLFWRNKFRLQKNSLIRIIILLVPLTLVFLTQPLIFLDFLSRNGEELLQRILAGNWNLILTPFIALGSIITIQTYTEVTSIAKIENFFQFLDFLIIPLFILLLATVFIGVGILKRPGIFISKIITATFLSIFLLYILSTHFVDHLITIKSIIQGLVGFYILIVAYVSFKYWLSQKDRILIGLFIGPFFAFVYILLTWVGAATSEVFVGAHRYLTIPAMGISFFLATIVIISFQRLYLLQKSPFIKLISFIPLILLTFFLKDNTLGIWDFFNFQLYNGFGFKDQQYMRNQLNSYLTDLSSNESSLFYFDLAKDNRNSYYYDNTIRGGFRDWMYWNKKINFKKQLAPALIWNQTDKLPLLIVKKGGRIGLTYYGKFYDIENFYAFRLNYKIVIDIKSEVLKNLGI